MKHTELHKKFLFTAVISSFLAGNSFSIQQPKLEQFNNYLDHLSIQGEQRSSLLEDFQYSRKLNLDTNKEDFSRYNKRRDKFDNKGKKDRLINEWEGKTKSPWPKHDRRSSEISQTRGIEGSPYEAHHIIPLGYNGKNEWWNIHPLTARQHIDIHSSSVLFKELFELAHKQNS